MFKRIFTGIVETIKNAFIEMYYYELDHIDNFYRANR